MMSQVREKVVFEVRQSKTQFYVGHGEDLARRWLENSPCDPDTALAKLAAQARKNKSQRSITTIGPVTVVAKNMSY
jgi:hypothetical protein